MRKSYRRSLWALGAVASYALFGFLALPAIVRAVALKKLPELLHRDVQLAALKMNPFDLSIDVLGFAVTEKSGAPFVSFDELYINARVLDLITGTAGFEEIRWVKPRAHVGLSKQGRLNFADLLQPAGAEPPPPPKEEPPARPPKVRIGVLSIQGGAISFRDETRALPFATEIGPIEIQLSTFSTEPEQNSPYAFEARFDQDSKVAWSGQLSVNPLRSTGTLSLEGIRLAPLRPYLAELSGLVLAEGSFAAKGNYRLDASQGALIFTVAEGRSSLSGVRIDSPSGAPRVRLGSLELRGISYDLGAQHAKVQRATVKDLELWMKRQANGEIDLLTEAAAPRTATATPTAPAPPPAKTSTKSPVQAELGGLSLAAAIHFVNEDAPRPMELELKAITLELGQVRFPTVDPISLQLGLTIGEKARFETRLSVSPLSSAVIGSVTLHDLPLSIAAPYLEERTTATLQDGVLALEATVDAKPGSAKISGVAAVERLSLLDAGGKEVLGFDKLSFEKIEGGLLPIDLTLDRILLSGLRVKLGLLPDGRLNLSTLEKKLPAAAPVPSPAEKPGPPPKLKVGAFALERGTIEIFDRTVQPALNLKLGGLGGRVSPLIVPGNAKMKIDLSGKVDAAPVKIAGELLSRGKASDLTLAVSLKGWDLLPLGGYFAKYAGYGLERGKLSLDLKIALANRQLDTHHLVLVDQLTLGDKVDSPDATWLPVKLALAILTNRDGQLELDVPITGDLDDPEFGVGRVIGRALLNILEKVATSPFALLGAIVGGSDDQLSELSFAAGSAELSALEAAKLEKIAKALRDRPALRVSLEGSLDPVADPEALARAKLAAAPKAPSLKTKTSSAALPPISAEELSALKDARAKVVQDALLSPTLGLSVERVFTKAHQGGEAPPAKSLVRLTLE